jgi:hypothetical protein
MPCVRTQFQSRAQHNTRPTPLRHLPYWKQWGRLPIVRQDDLLLIEARASINLELLVLDTRATPGRGNSYAKNLWVGVPILARLGLLTVWIDRIERHHSCWHFTLECGADSAIRIQSLAYRIQIQLGVWERHSRQKSWRAFAEIGKSPSYPPNPLLLPSASQLPVFLIQFLCG